MYFIFGFIVGFYLGRNYLSNTNDVDRTRYRKRDTILDTYLLQYTNIYPSSTDDI